MKKFSVICWALLAVLTSSQASAEPMAASAGLIGGTQHLIRAHQVSGIQSENNLEQRSAGKTLVVGIHSVDTVYGINTRFLTTSEQGIFTAARLCHETSLRSNIEGGIGRNIEQSMTLQGRENILFTSFATRTITQDTIRMCSGDSVWLHVPENLSTILWFPDGVKSDSLLVFKGGSYYAVVENVHGDTIIVESTVVELTIPPLTIIQGAEFYCKGDNLRLMPTASGGNCHWRGPNGFESTDSIICFPNLDESDEGYYSLTISENGCYGDPDSLFVSVFTEEDLNLRSSGPVKVGDDLELVVDNYPGVPYRWKGPDGLYGHGSSIKLDYVDSASTGWYVVQARFTRRCRIEDSLFVNVEPIQIPEGNPLIPNGFSPNGDGVNDIWHPTKEEGPLQEVVVFNRAGKMIYRMSGENLGWNGITESGELAPEGTYFYVLKVMSKGEPKEWTGWVQLMR